MRVKIGSRSSDLARMQAYMVGEQLAALGAEVEYSFRESLGDLNPKIDLSKTFEKGVFTQDFYQGLVDGTYDLVVHSWKDLPTEERLGTEVVATLPRADMRDVLVVKTSALTSPLRTLKIFSSSPRRAYNLEGFLHAALPLNLDTIEFVPVRGNVQTRFRKLLEQDDVAGLVVAKAALDRMLGSTSSEFDPTRKFLRQALNHLNWMVLPLSINPCAAAQGALALEIRESDHSLRTFLKENVNCERSWEAAVQERRILKNFGGGCHQKIGVSVLIRPYGRILSLRGLTDKGEVLNQFQVQHRQPLSSPISRERIFPAPDDVSLAFETNDLPQSYPEKDLWISKAKALPLGWNLKNEKIVWTAGLQTWRQLAARGVWVNGSAEGLGEHEEENLGYIMGRQPEWVKLSHKAGVETQGKALLPTYELKGDLEIPLIEKKDYFFWNSGSQFLHVWNTHSEVLLKAHHACGPGHTLSVLEAYLPDPKKIDVFLSREDWWAYLGCLNQTRT